MGDKQKFLQRERSALTRRRQIFGEKVPNKMVYLTPKSDRRSDNFVVDNIQDMNFRFFIPKLRNQVISSSLSKVCAMYKEIKLHRFK